MKFLLGIDVGSSSVKCALVAIDSGECVASAYSPSSEMKIHSPQAGFAEQDPETWWKELRNAMAILADEYDFKKNDIAAIGISYQMHGLVMLDKEGNSLRPSIIWCDSRAVELGNNAFKENGFSFLSGALFEFTRKSYCIQIKMGERVSARCLPKDL